MIKTKVIDLKGDFNIKKLNQAVNIIKDGGLVAIPTETVYGLAANGLNGEAVGKIFKAKNRPNDNPLILHISNLEEIYTLSKNISSKDIEILEKIWPGPLTVVVQKSELIPNEITAGLKSVAIRIPNNELTRKFINLCGVPLAAPSANLSTKPSPTSAKSVLEDMDGKIDAIIDGGESNIGIESTVLDLTSDIPKILRPGFYTKEMLEKYWEKVEYDLAINDEKKVPKSPGQKYKHYAPDTEVLVLIGDDDAVYIEIEKLLMENKKIGLMLFETDRENFKEEENIIYMGSKEQLSEMGRILFDALRKLDKQNLDKIVVRGVEEEGYGLSIMNRLKKSSSNNIRRL